MKIHSRVLVAALLVSTITARADTPTEPTIAKSSIMIATRRQAVLVTGKKRDETRFSWTPRIKFTVNGPIAAGSVFSVDFLQGKKAWLTIPMGTIDQDAAAGTTMSFSWTGNDLHEEQGIAADGDFAFKIQMKNELQGKNATVYSGSFNVKKFHPPNLVGEMAHADEYYVDQDWNLPIGYLTLKRRSSSYGVMKLDPPALAVAMWFRADSPAPKAYLFYKDKAVGAAVDGYNDGDMDIATFNTSVYSWRRQRFPFSTVVPTELADSKFDGAFYLDKNPGDYEVKIMRGGKLVRSMKFTVADGKVVDNGLADKISLNDDDRLMFPVKVIGTTDGDGDGKIDVNAWKKGAFYSTPIPGFAPPP